MHTALSPCSGAPALHYSCPQRDLPHPHALLCLWTSRSRRPGWVWKWRSRERVAVALMRLEAAVGDCIASRVLVCRGASCGRGALCASSPIVLMPYHRRLVKPPCGHPIPCKCTKREQVIPLDSTHPQCSLRWLDQHTHPIKCTSCSCRLNTFVPVLSRNRQKKWKSKQH
ncbi:hypothetical protein BJY52DRAFT_738018 [Lactarius psammicola]|nr:hypothetical protein BJY52DRAFT_738018 [Lactarius psammicola]